MGRCWVIEIKIQLAARNSASYYFFIRYFLYFTFQMLSPFLVSPPLLTNPVTPSSWPWHSTTLGYRAFTGPRASPPIDDQLDHPLLHMWLESWVPLCVFFGWWFSPWDLWGYWLAHIVVLPMGLQIPLAPWVLSLVPSLGTLYSVQWLWASTSVFVRHWQSLLGNSYIGLLATKSCWHPQCLGLVTVYGMDPQVG